MYCIPASGLLHGAVAACHIAVSFVFVNCRSSRVSSSCIEQVPVEACSRSARQTEQRRKPDTVEVSQMMNRVMRKFDNFQCLLKLYPPCLKQLGKSVGSNTDYRLRFTILFCFYFVLWYLFFSVLVFKKNARERQTDHCLWLSQVFESCKMLSKLSKKDTWWMRQCEL